MYKMKDTCLTFSLSLIILPFIKSFLQQVTLAWQWGLTDALYKMESKQIIEFVFTLTF
jgi:hypothetical protein